MKVFDDAVAEGAKDVVLESDTGTGVDGVGEGASVDGVYAGDAGLSEDGLVESRIVMDVAGNAL